MVNGCLVVAEEGEWKAKKETVEISAFWGVEIF
jgi:hypothetical protein